MKGFGYKQDPHDPRDILFEDRTHEFKSGITNTTNEHLLKDESPISDQLNLQSCVADSTTSSLEILMGIEGLPIVQLSRLLTYWNSRVPTSDTDKDQGTYIRNAFNSLKILGVCPESEWGYDVDNVFAQPPITAFQAANSNKIDSFYRISSSGKERADAIELAIRSDKPVVFGAAVSKDFVSDFSGNEQVWDTPTDVVGNHAMVITGVRINSSNKREFLIRNSWGFTWGRNGRNWLTEDYLGSDLVQDVWVPTAISKII